MLGDLLELRERRADEVLSVAAPVLAAIGEALEGREIVLAPGNHDYELVSPALEGARLDGRELEREGTYAADTGPLSSRVAAMLAPARVSLAYPGLWLRDDVWATHGHYADLHLTVPRVESIFAHGVGRMVGAGARDVSLETYEATVAPVYAFSHAVAQSSPAQRALRGGNTSREVWSRATGGGLSGLRARTGGHPRDGRGAEPPGHRPLPGGHLAARAPSRRPSRDGAGGARPGRAGRPRGVRPHPSRRPAARRGRGLVARRGVRGCTTPAAGCWRAPSRPPTVPPTPTGRGGSRGWATTGRRSSRTCWRGWSCRARYAGTPAYAARWRR